MSPYNNQLRLKSKVKLLTNHQLTKFLQCDTIWRMKTLYIGDIHRRFRLLEELLLHAQKYHDFDEIVQVGDFGHYNNFDNWNMNPEDTQFVNPTLVPFRWIDGNHESFPCKSFDGAEYIPRGTRTDNRLFVGGGYSHDMQHRIFMADHSPEEQISYRQMHEIMSVNKQVDTVVAHDTIADCYSEFGIDPHPSSSHSANMQAIFEKFRPKRWIHGHLHVPKRYTYKGCEFISLGTVSFYQWNTIKRGKQVIKWRVGDTRNMFRDCCYIG